MDIKYTAGDYTLHLENEAYTWENITPVGCGSLGASVYGTVKTERIQLNEESIWSGEHQSQSPAGYPEKIKQIRELLLDGKNAEAERYAHEVLGGTYLFLRPYETAGELTIDLHRDGLATGYSRDLDLMRGIATVAYEKNGAGYSRQIFASYEKCLIAIKISSDTALDLKIGYDPVRTGDYVHSVQADGAAIFADIETAYGGHRFAVGIKAEPGEGGSIIESPRFGRRAGGASKTISVCGCNECFIYVAVKTELKCGGLYMKECRDALSQKHDYNELLSRHKADFSSLMRRSDISFDCADKALSAMPVNERLARLRDAVQAAADNANKGSDNDGGDVTDLGLLSLYYQFGRYLLVSSSRPGTLPANLQGVWNGSLHPAWNCNYTTNINLQMNYWGAEISNLGECQLPLFDFMNNTLLDAGRHVARTYYGINGTVLHHITDIYGFAAPADGPWGVWPMGAAWLSTHMYEHYLFTLDRKFLRDTAYVYMKESVRFILEYLFYDPATGYLATGPSASPENAYFTDETHTERANLCMSPTMDIEIVGALLRDYIDAEAVLGIDESFAKKAKAALDRLPPLQIGRYGQLMEWQRDYDEPEPGHRHISHAFALYPDNAVTRAKPELYNAIRRTIERRLSSGGGHTGWSCAWLCNLYARLRDGDGTYRTQMKLLTKSTNDNLFDSHPPFQIDGNFGGSASVAEAVMQSHEGFVSLLPALTSKQLAGGKFTGLCARGGVVISAEWLDGCVTEITLQSRTSDANTVKIELPSGQRNKNFVCTDSGERVIADESGILTVTLTDMLILKSV